MSITNTKAKKYKILTKYFRNKADETDKSLQIAIDTIVTQNAIMKEEREKWTIVLDEAKMLIAGKDKIIELLNEKHLLKLNEVQRKYKMARDKIKLIEANILAAQNCNQEKIRQFQWKLVENKNKKSVNDNHDNVLNH